MPTSLRNWTLLLILSVIWGSSFILMKQGLTVFLPEQVAAIRIFSAFLTLVPAWFFINPRPLAKEGKWKYLLLIAFINSGIPPFLFALAQTRISSAMAGILNSLSPLFTLLVGVLMFHIRLTTFKMAGVLVGLCGAVMLIWFNADSGIQAGGGYGMLVVLAAFLYGLGANLLKSKLGSFKPLTLTTVGLSFIGPPAGFYLFSQTDFLLRVQTHPDSLQALGLLFILGSIGTALAIVLFNYLIQGSSVVFASSVTYLMPIVSIFWGVVFNEKLSWIDFLGMGIILSGVYLTSRDKK